MQESLFSNHTDTDHFEDHVLGRSRIREYPAGLSAGAASRYFEQLINETPWRQENIRIAGRELPVPRLQCWMGDAESLYGYSGIRLQPVPWHPAVAAIRERVQALAGQTFNSVLLNYYRDGQDSVSWHADDETELGANPVIVSVSLGAERVFQLKPKDRQNRARFRLPLRHGAVLIMDRHLQRDWLHQVPKSRTVREARINLTFRDIVRNDLHNPDAGDRAGF